MYIIVVYYANGNVYQLELCDVVSSTNVARELLTSSANRILKVEILNSHEFKKMARESNE